VDQHSFAGLQAQPLEHLVGGQAGQRQARRCVPPEGGRLAGQESLRQRDVLGEASAVDVVLAAVGDDLVAGLELPGVNSHRLHNSCYIPARYSGKLQIHDGIQVPRRDFPVHRVYRSCLDSDQDHSRPDFRHRLIPKFEDIGASV
jgi:hypothetical protein